MKRDVDLSLVEDLSLSQLQRAARAFGLELKIELTLEDEEVIDLTDKVPATVGQVLDVAREQVGAHEAALEEAVAGAGRELNPEAAPLSAPAGGPAATPSSTTLDDDQPYVTCLNPECRKPLVQKPIGRRKMYCDGRCKSRSNVLRSQAARAATSQPSTDVPVEEPAELEPPAPDLGPKCARCGEHGHGVLACPQPLVKKDKTSKLRDQGVVARVTPGGVTIHELSHAEREERRRQMEESPVVVPPKVEGGATDEELSASASKFAELWRDGMPERIGFEYLPDVLALYGVDEGMVNATLTQPDRVEVRPESFSKEKRYPVLGFFRGDVNVILGLRNPSIPCVIAVYVTSKLENDTHRVEYTGGGGSKATKGLPKNPRQMLNRLRGMGCQATHAPGENAVEVVYDGQSLGKVNVGPTANAQTVQSDYQRCVRRIEAMVKV